MEEAERLADRVAVIDRGRLVALDSPAGLVAKSKQEQRIVFRPSSPVDEHVMRALPGVTGVGRRGEQLVVTGEGNVLHSVTSYLVRNAIVAEQLRVDQVDLDDAYVALTGHRPDADDATRAASNTRS